MNGEELNRKYHELCGWVPFPGNAAARAVWHRPECRFQNFAWTSRCVGFGTDEGCRDELPPLHLDANLAIAELRAEMKRQRESRGDSLPHWYELRINQGEPIPATVCSIWRNKRGDDGLLSLGLLSLVECYAVSGAGMNECEAILKALIAAKEQSAPPAS